eukprot:TRINITY_DN486_c0_g2_i1.p1 TRINITY_DN486_c0_g2~~TRINITY_DN486_c0_g2_i1.p1  ORF type:complete len:397 (-),score=102.35 TRINITY_DN486_c0_g2_i1:506-1651(-)
MSNSSISSSDFESITSNEESSSESSEYLGKKYLPELKDLTDEQKEMCREMLEREDVRSVMREMDNNIYMISRWLIARNWDMEKAVEMFINTMNWREENNINTLLEDLQEHPKFEILRDYWPSSQAHRDILTHDGSPVFYERVGMTDPKSVLNDIPLEELISFHLYDQELREKQIYDLCIERGYYTGAIFVQDLTGLGWKHMYKPALNLLQKSTYMDADNYPELIRKLYIVNCPHVFQIIWKIISPWFDKKSLEKMSIITSGYEDELLSFIDADKLPDFLGGNSTDIVTGGGVYDDRGKKIKIKKGKKKEVARGEIFKLPLEIGEGNTVISWMFNVNQYDIGFRVEYNKHGDDDDEPVSVHNRFYYFLSIVPKLTNAGNPTR